MKKYLTLSVFLFSFPIFSQNNREITYGIFAGGLYSKMENLTSIIIPPSIYQNFSTQEKGKFGGLAGLFINWKYTDAHISIQPEVSFAFQSTDFLYEDNKGLNYKINFGYQNINTGFLVKYYPINNLYIGAGPFLGLNISRDAITYTSNGSELSQANGAYYEPDAVVQKVLKDALKGNDHFYFMFATGYEFANKMTVSFRYNLGMTDALSTEQNGFKYRENKNRINGFSLYFGYMFDFEDNTNF